MESSQHEMISRKSNLIDIGRRITVSSRYKIGDNLAGPLQIFLFTDHHDLETQLVSYAILWAAILSRELTISPEILRRRLLQAPHQCKAPRIAAAGGPMNE